MKTFAELRAIYERAIEQDRTRKDSTKKYIRECLLCAGRVWPEIEAKDIATITKLECQEWAGKLSYSASRYNGIIQHVRAVFELAVDVGLRTDNPMQSVKRMSVRIKPPKLPTSAEFRKILDRLGNTPQCKDALLMIRFLACSGLRINEARRLKREDISEYGIRIEEQKNGETSYVPLLPELRELLKELPASGPLFKIKDPRRALRTSCKKLGLPHMTNHHLRHLFATHAIECGVDIKTVAHWLRHKDGGALALKRYAHVRDEHSLAQAAKVTPLS